MTSFQLQSAFNDYLGPPGSAPALAGLRRELDARKAVSTRDDLYFSPLAAPLLLDRDQSVYLRHASERIVALLTTELGRWAPKEPDLLAALRTGDRIRPFVSEALPGNVTVSRCDFLWSRDGWRLIEVNIGGAVGGLDVLDYNEVVEADPLVGTFLRKHDLTAESPIASLADAALDTCARLDIASSQPVLAIVDSPEFEPVYHLAFRKLAKHYAAKGFRVIISHQGTLSLRDGHLYAGDVHIDVVHREFTFEDMLETPDPALPVFHAARAGTVVLISGFREELLGGKAMLALLWDAAERGVLAAADARLIRDVVPETRLLHRPAAAALAGAGGAERLDGVPREGWVIKPSIGGSSISVTLGPSVTDQTFQQAVTTAVQSDQAWVAQRFMPSEPVVLPLLLGDEVTFDGCQIHPSFFVSGGQTTGAWTRAIPGKSPALIAMANGAMFGGLYQQR